MEMFFILDLMSSNINLNHLLDSKTNYCQYFPLCGGCDLLNIENNIYQTKKKTQLITILKRYKIPVNYIENIDWIWLESSSRRRIFLKINKNNELGFFKKRSQDLVSINDCKATTTNINRLIKILSEFIKNQAQNLWLSIAITEFDNIIDLIFYSKKSLSFKQNEQLKELAIKNKINISVSCSNNNNSQYIEPLIIHESPQIHYNYHKPLIINLVSNVFLQATKRGMLSIFSIIRNYISHNFYQKNLKIKVIDFYSGFGGYSFAIIDLINSSIAFEGYENMVSIANKNSKKYQLNIESFTRDLFKFPVLSDQINKFDLAIINPPRNGASPQIKAIAESQIQYLIYVSCNPISWARDSEELIKKGFKIKQINAIDQFYGTQHIELVVIFSRSC